MGEEKKTNVAFGTEAERKNFPFDVGKSRFGNHMNPITGVPNVGPGKYDNDEMTSMVHVLNTRPVSTRGYTLGARDGPRIQKDFVLDTPGPGAYEPLDRDPVKPAYKPFNIAVARDPCRLSDRWTTPGPGTYDHKRTDTCRHVKYSQSFGGPPRNLPCVTQWSTVPSNTDKLPTTRDEKRYLRRLAYLKLYYK